MEKAAVINGKRSPGRKSKWNLKRNWPLYVMLIPPLTILAIFHYAPMYGIIIAFQDFSPVNGFLGSPFVGLKWFRYIFSIPDFKNLLSNTLVLAVGKLVISQVASIVFALSLNEVKNMLFKRTVQTFVYLPHFLSWVILGGIFIDILSTKGILNQFLSLFGIRPIFFLGSNTWFRPAMIATDVWKTFGWGAILYIAAITNINPELYESAAIDGANRFRQMWHITIPGILPTIILLGALNLGAILNAGFDQILMMYNPAVYQTGDIIDTFVYRMGLIQAQFSLAAAVGLFKSVIGCFLIVLSYRLAYKYANYRIL